MRILRGKSNLEVSSKGFAWFVVGLVLATFMGGAVRTILRSDQVHTRIVNELRARFPQHQFQMDKTEVILSRGLWPGLGLRLTNLSFRQDVCGKLSFVMEVPQAVLPVDLLSLRKGKVRLGRVELHDGRMHFDYYPCAENPKAMEESKLSAVDRALKRPALAAPALDWQKVARHLDAIQLDNFTLTYERNVTWRALVHSMRLNLSDELAAHGVMEVRKILPEGHLSHTIDIEASGDGPILQWGIRSEFKEGTVRLKGSLDLNNQVAVIQANARQLPLKDLVSDLHQMGFVERDLRLKTTWLSCGVKWEGSLVRPEEAPIHADDCKIEGGYGRIDLESAEFWLPNLATLKKPALLKVSKLQMQPLLEALGRQVLPRVLAKPGVWSGELSYLSGDSWRLDGHLEQVEVVFSNRSVRGKQVLERLRTRVERGSGRIEAKVDELQIRGGDFQGELQFTLLEDWRNGDFKAEIAKLRFNPSIQILLVGGVLGELKFSGQGALQAGELGRWSGDFELSQASGAGWEVLGVQGKSRYSPGVFHLEGGAREARILPEWGAYAQLKTVRPESSGAVTWHGLQARVDILGQGGSIESVSGVEKSSQQPWRLKGSWVRDGEFNALLSLGPGKAQTFMLRGEKGLLNVQEPLR